MAKKIIQQELSIEQICWATRKEPLSSLLSKDCIEEPSDLLTEKENSKIKNASFTRLFSHSKKRIVFRNILTVHESLESLLI